MALKIYGVARARAARVLWMVKELGLDYEHVRVDFATGETRQPAHLALNPNGHIPVIDDNGFILWESMAINLYLAKKYGAGGLYPSRLEDEARAWQWSLWSMTEVERPVLTAMMNRAIFPENQRDLAAADAAEKTLAQPLRVLDGVLGPTPYLLDEPSPTSTSPAFSPGRGRRRSTCPPSQRLPSGSRSAPSGRRRALSVSCSGNETGGNDGQHTTDATANAGARARRHSAVEPLHRRTESHGGQHPGYGRLCIERSQQGGLCPRHEPRERGSDRPR